jgi:tripartite-type tricarboxylate transporter receptor subunit TctC
MVASRKLKNLMLAVALSGAALVAHSDEAKPLRILVGFVPGGTSDTVARMLADELRTTLKRTVLVENRPGAGGRIAAEQLKAARADGSTYLFSPDSWAVFPTLLVPEETLRYNYLVDMAPVARVISYPLGLYASNAAGVKDLQSFVARAKADPGMRMFASAGAGSITEFLGVVMSREFGVDMTVVPYKGAAEVKTALLGNQAMIGIMAPGEVLKHVGSGISPLGFMSKKRWSVAPDIPTMEEQGFKVVQGEAFMALWASSKVSKAERDVMEDAVRRVLQKPEFRKRLERASVAPDFADAAELDKQVRDLLAFWGPLLKESGYKR